MGRVDSIGFCSAENIKNLVIARARVSRLMLYFDRRFRFYLWFLVSVVED